MMKYHESPNREIFSYYPLKLKKNCFKGTSTDSGFLSNSDSSLTDLTSSTKKLNLDLLISSKYKNKMHLDDSKVNLSEKFSELLIKNGLEQNDLDKPKKSSNTELLSNDFLQLPTSWEIFAQDEDGDTPLHIAIIHNVCDAVYALLRLTPNACLLDARNDNLHTALHLAVLANHPDVVRQLVVAGANINIRDSDGNTALHLACREGNENVIKAILTPVSMGEIEDLGLIYKPVHNNIDCRQLNYKGEMCIHIAARSGHVNALKCLTKYGADVNAQEILNWMTPLHIAASQGNIELIKFLLTDCPKIRTEIMDYCKRRAYQVASSSYVCDVLAQFGVDTYSSASDDDSNYNSSDCEMS